jgi:hypothetical protein
MASCQPNTRDTQFFIFAGGAAPFGAARSLNWDDLWAPSGRKSAHHSEGSLRVFFTLEASRKGFAQMRVQPSVAFGPRVGG